MKNHHDSKFILIGAAVVLVIGLIIFSFTSKTNTPDFEQVNKSQVETEEVPDNYIRRLSDGVFVDPAEQVKRYIGIMVENSADAWPLSGVSQARLVIEAPVEGSIPRFFVLFDDKQEVDQIGPVRSARPYYVRWAHGMKSMYGHVGGSPDGLALIKRISIQDINEFFFGKFFWRSQQRYAPHNVYTSVENMLEAAEEKEFEEQQLQPLFAYHDDSVSSEEPQSFTVPFSNQGSLYKAGWEYLPESNTYQRYQAGDLQSDLDSIEVQASNVLVFFTDISVIDEIGRKKIRTEGEGDGVAYIGGYETEITWKKETSADHFQVYIKGTDEEVVLLNAGATWLEVVSIGTEILDSI